MLSTPTKVHTFQLLQFMTLAEFPGGDPLTNLCLLLCALQIPTSKERDEVQSVKLKNHSSYLAHPSPGTLEASPISQTHVASGSKHTSRSRNQGKLTSVSLHPKGAIRCSKVLEPPG